MIYFVQPISGGNIKIGNSKYLSDRIASLESTHKCKLHVLGVMDGGLKQERQIHRRFAHAAIGHEWFSPCPALIDFMSRETRMWDGENECPPPPRVITRSIVFEIEVFKAMEAETVKHGYGSQSRLVNHAMRKLLKLKPRETSFQRATAKT